MIKFYYFQLLSKLYKVACEQPTYGEFISYLKYRIRFKLIRGCAEVESKQKPTHKSPLANKNFLSGRQTIFHKL